MFEIKTETISVAKNGGVERLIEEIYRGGKGKASIYKRVDKEFIQIKTKEENTYYEIDNS